MAFKPLIVASNASGSGASGGGSGGGAAKKPSEMNAQERADFEKNDPQKIRNSAFKWRIY